MLTVHTIPLFLVQYSICSLRIFHSGQDGLEIKSPACHFHATFPCLCCIHVPATFPCLCCMDLNKKHGQGHAAWTLTYSWDMDTKHGHGHASWTSVCILLVPVHSMLHVYVHNVHIACPCPYCTFMSVLHVPAHASRPFPC